MESRKRSILKTVTWRLTATLVTSMVVYLFTREVILSIGIGSMDAVIKMFAYYGHERLWDRTEFGRKQEIKEDYMI